MRYLTLTAVFALLVLFALEHIPIFSPLRPLLPFPPTSPRVLRFFRVLERGGVGEGEGGRKEGKGP